MTTTELIKLLQDNEKGGISHRPRKISLTVNGRYIPEPQITISSTGDGIVGPEIALDVDGEWFEYEADEIDEVLDKIRAEILEEKECAYADFERYKVEYLRQDWEDALDSLPQDDFRYGMERAIEIIDKYKAESEE